MILSGAPMRRERFLIQAKLTPPRPYRRVLSRPALLAKLHEAFEYRVTILQASAGYGKTTALTSLATSNTPVCWYTITEEDVDPHRFLAYLIAACHQRWPNLSDLPQALLQESHNEQSSAAWSQVLDALLNAVSEQLNDEVLVILDDYHFVAHIPEIHALTTRLITYMPPGLHLVLSTRYPIDDRALIRWRARGDILALNREDFAFQSDEIATLFTNTYEMQISSTDVVALADQTEGWPIALQLIWQGMRGGGRSASPANLPDTRLHSLATLFEYLAHDVVNQQSPEIADFLRETAILRELTPDICNAVRAADDSAALLNQLHRLDLFTVAVDEDMYRYHHLFHDFLRQQAHEDLSDTNTRHCRAAHCFAEQHNDEAAIYHWLSARAFTEAAMSIGRIGETMIRDGRLDTLLQWIDTLPADILADQPRLHAYLGDIYRLRSQFEKALSWYQQAEQTWQTRGDFAGQSRALRGQARVYLDRVQPAQAEHLLQEAIRLTDGINDRQTRARLLELMAENKLNMGKTDEAEMLCNQAHELREEGPGEDMLSVRVKLRTGRLDEARITLEPLVNDERQLLERGHPHSPRGHRETVLLLSLIEAFCGNGQRAFCLAHEGVGLGEQLASPFITAVAHIRLGHAWQLRTHVSSERTTMAHDEALGCYQRSIALSDQLAVRRLRAEALWGLTRAYGFSRQLAAAEQTAHEGVEISQWAGDQWLAALIELTLGSSCVLAGRLDNAIDTLTRVLGTFRDCGDSFGQAATRLWLALAYHQLKQREHALTHINELLNRCKTHQYSFLLTTPTLTGPPDLRCLVPLLVAARDGHHADYATRVLATMGLPGIEAHPGYQLRVQTLGNFRVWRGVHEIAGREWQRDKARQLFQLLISHPGRWLQRDEIVEMLWPHLGPDSAMRDFKVALNALNKALEPHRSPNVPFSFIVRNGSAYRLRPEADLHLDYVEFEQACTQGMHLLDEGNVEEGITKLRAALQLYGGDYLPDALYESWSSEPCDRILALYLRTAAQLASALIEHEAYEEAIHLCQQILEHDPCWERAYCTLMVVHTRQGNRALALRTYQRCVEALHTHLGVDPDPATVALEQQIRASGGV